MGIFLTLSLFFLILGGVSVFGYMHYAKPARLLDQLATTTSDAIPSPVPERNRRASPIAKLLGPVGNLIPISPQDASAAKDELIAAGIRSSSAVATYYGIKILLSVILLAVAVVFRGHFANPMLRVVAPIAAAGIGYFMPAFILGRMVKRRHLEIRLSLPDVLDLMVICTEAGCGLDQAIVNVSRELKSVHPALSEELTFVNMAIMAGTSRAEALRNMGRRTGEEEVKKLVAILVQTDRFGTSVSEALRTQSEFMRIRRRQDAEERAGKVGVKLVFPIFFFCLPSLLVVTAGPGMLQLFHNLFPVMNSFHQ